MGLRKLKRKKLAARQKSRPRSAPADRPVTGAALYQELAMADQYLRAGQAEKAEKLYKLVLSRVPDNDHALLMLGMIAHEKGNNDRARELIERAIEINPDQPVYHSNLGIVLRDLDRDEDAVACFDRALALEPEFYEVLNNKANGLQKLGRLEEAFACHQKALGLRPGSPETYLNLGTLLMEQGKNAAAIEHFHKAVQLKPDYAFAHRNMGLACEEIGKADQAIACYQKALQLMPDDASVYIYLGKLYAQIGKQEQAFSHYSKALEVQPDNGAAIYSLAMSRRYDSPDHEDAVRARKLLKRSNLPENEAGSLHFALGKIYDDCGLYQEAFGHFRQGNQIKHSISPWDKEEFYDSIEKTISIFTPELIERLKPLGCDSELPVFIIGMPRSGTTLVEQIIASHPRAQGAGELSKIQQIADSWSTGQEGDLGYPENIVTLDREETQDAARGYLEFIREKAGDTPLRITDKMPYNFLHLGLINILFPRSRIIHCQRHPLDCCLSMYFQSFQTGNQHTYDLTSLGEYYCQYVRLMAHWQRVLSLDIFEIRYEELIRAQEEKTREMLQFLGLEWDERCLSFHRTRRSVESASIWQVREPLYSRSVNRWRNYDEFLAPLREALGELAPDS
ncbi:MAG: tetratricopeptide repeat protein [Desulfobacterales bacterium]|nr:tetratricopeptide repeat protein [Desulfobacterales bacterium]